MLFATQFGGAGFRHIPRLGCYSAHIFLFEGWVWPGLWGCGACWNRPHIFLQSAAPKAKGSCCYWRHNSQGSLFRTGLLLTTQLGVQQTARSRWLGLLFAAHFKAGCARRLFSGILHAGLLFSAHFLIADVPVFIAIPPIFCFLSAVVIVCTFLRFTAAFPSYPPQQTKKMLGCYPQHNSMYSVSHSVSKLRIRQQPRQIQLGRQNPLRVPLKKISSSPLLSSAHFQNLKNPFQFSPPTIAQQKYFLRQFML